MPNGKVTVLDVVTDTVAAKGPSIYPLPETTLVGPSVIIFVAVVTNFPFVSTRYPGFDEVPTAIGEFNCTVELFITP